MSSWYAKYLSIYGKSYEEIPGSVLEEIKSKLATKQSNEPLISIVVIAYNEERRLSACLWSLSELQTTYPVEILGVNNNSKDRTEEVYRRLGLPYYNELKQSPGYARQCGLNNDLMMTKLSKPDVSCVSSFWSFFPDKNHSRLGLFLFESIRDIFLYIQHFKRPELCVRGMVFAFKTDFARLVKIRTDIRRGEDGSLALSLKKYGKIVFLYNRKARPVTGYGTFNDKSILKGLFKRIIIQGKDITRFFYKTDHYKDTNDNLIQMDKY